jgi:hypothetical protein
MNKTIRLTVRLDTPIFEVISDLALREEISISAAIRRFLRTASPKAIDSKRL